jgi:hypothetical protein
LSASLMASIQSLVPFSVSPMLFPRRTLVS